MLRSTQRTADIVSAVPPLRLVFARAFQGGAFKSDARPRGGPKRSNDRRPSAAGPSSAAPVRRGLPVSASSLYGGSSFRQDERPNKGHHPRTTNRQLAKLPVAEPLEPFTDRPRHVRHPKSQPFTPQTYPLPKMTAETEALSAPKPFDAFLMIPKLLDLMHQKYGVTGKTTPVQSLSLNHFLPSYPVPARVLLGGETGSGKTLAYLLPLFHHLKTTDPKGLPANISPFLTPEQRQRNKEILLPRSIVLSPTHELNRQSTAFAKTLCHHVKLSVVGMSDTKFSGVGYRTGSLDVLLGTGNSMRKVLGLDKEWSREEEDANPSWMQSDKRYWHDESVQRKQAEGKKALMRNLDRKAFVGVDNVDWVIIDEADVLLGPDFAAETLSILNHIHVTRPSANFVLVTATVPPSLMHLLRTDPLLSSIPFTQLVSPGMHKLPKMLEARFVPRSNSGNLLTDVAHELSRIIAEDGVARRLKGRSGEWVEKSKIIVFCNSDVKVKQLSQLLDERGMSNLAWTGDNGVRVRGKNGVLGTFLLSPDSGLRRPPKKDKDVEEVDPVLERVDAEVDAILDASEAAAEADAADELSEEERDELMSLLNGAEDSGQGNFEVIDGEEMIRQLDETADDDHPLTPESRLGEPSSKISNNDVESTPPASQHETESLEGPLEAKTPRILITTSLLSRGLDFAPSVSTVVLVDKPKDVLDFVHRAGRAGRAGRPGRVVVFGMGDGKDKGKGAGGLGKGVEEVVGQVTSGRLHRRAA